MTLKSFWRWFLHGSEDATYVRDIQVLKPEKPLRLPLVKPLKARIVPTAKVKRQRAERKSRAGQHEVIPMRRTQA